MIILYPGGLRSYWVDRNPVTKVISYVDWITGDVGTVVATYTVPANRRAKVTGVNLQLLRETVSAAIQEAALSLSSTTSGPGGNHFQATLYDNAIGANDHVAMNAEIILNAGERVDLFIVDGNATGLIMVSGMVTIVEYDG